jgi:hypothetical protein
MISAEEKLLAGKFKIAPEIRRRVMIRGDDVCPECQHSQEEDRASTGDGQFVPPQTPPGMLP